MTYSKGDPKSPLLRNPVTYDTTLADFFNIDCKQQKTYVSQEPDGNGGFRIPNFNPGDGGFREFLAINGSMPGPPLVVYENSLVTVHVKNNLIAKTISIHWHGIPQHNNNANDGLAYVTQPPIIPREVYTYTFRVESAGTFFYHDHAGPFRGDGIQGALIVLPRVPPTGIDSEFVMFLQDWTPGLSEEEFNKGQWGISVFSEQTATTRDTCYAETKTFDGSKVSEWEFNSLLVNGHGWRSLKDLETKPHQLPLHKYVVQKGGTYQFRAVGGMDNFGVMISIEGHQLTVTATDGFPVKDTPVDYLIIYPGERYDFKIQAMVNPGRRHFFIKVQTLETIGENGQLLSQPHFTLAVLEYSKFSTTAPSSTNVPSLKWFSDCSARTIFNPCVVLNCPMAEISKFRANLRCISVTSLQSVAPADPKIDPHFADSAVTQTKYLNVFAHPWLNGIQYTPPSSPPAMAHQINDVIKPCSECTTSPCACTHYHNFTLGETIDIVFFSHPLQPLSSPLGLAGPIDAYAHPMHVHGHTFRVVKTVYPTYHGVTGFIDKYNSEVPTRLALGQGQQGTFQPLLNAAPVRKDTVLVPVGGYTVIRLYMDNPGWWLSHCHMTHHNLGGMAFLLHTEAPQKRIKGKSGQQPKPAQPQQAVPMANPALAPKPAAAQPVIMQVNPNKNAIGKSAVQMAQPAAQAGKDPVKQMTGFIAGTILLVGLVFTMFAVVWWKPRKGIFETIRNH